MLNLLDLICWVKFRRTSMKKRFLFLILSLIFLGVSNISVKAQATSPIPLRLSASEVCDKSRGSWPLNMAMDSAKNKFLVCTQNYNGQGGLEIALKVVKYNPNASQVIYSILINTGSFVNSDIAVDANGTAFVLHGSNITRISADGLVVEGWASISLSEGKSLLVDPLNNLFVSGQLNNDAAVVKVRPDGSTAFVQTIGGSGYDIANAVAYGSNQTVILTGRTDSPDFPAINALQPFSGGGSDAFLVRLNSNSGTVLSSTYLGGNGFDEGRGLAAGNSGALVVVGETDSTNFPIFNAIQASISGQKDSYISKFNSTGSSLIYSTYLGGSGTDSAVGVTLDNAENAILTGVTSSNNFPTFRSEISTLEGNWQAFLTKLSTNGSSFLFSTYQSGGSGNFYDGFDIVDDSIGGVFLSVNSNKYFSGGESSGMVLRFSPYQIRLLYDPSKPFKPNPSIQVQLQDLVGTNQSSVGIPVTSLHVSPRGSSSYILKMLGGDFTFGANLKFGGSAPGGYKYLLDRTGLGAGDYDLVFTTANETVWRTVPFSLK
jgi:hypothetical protein